MYYFVYAPIINSKQMQGLFRGSQPKCSAILPGHKLIFTGWSIKWQGGTASIKPSSREKVLGVVYDIPDECLSQVDRYQDYPDMYNRLNKRVVCGDGSFIQVIAYVKRGDAEMQPSHKYLATIASNIGSIWPSREPDTIDEKIKSFSKIIDLRRKARGKSIDGVP